MPKIITVHGEPILLDQLVSSELGPVLARQLLPEALILNPGLADFGSVIPIGRDVIIPDRPATSTFSARPIVSLFG